MRYCFQKLSLVLLLAFIISAGQLHAGDGDQKERVLVKDYTRLMKELNWPQGQAFSATCEPPQQPVKMCMADNDPKIIRNSKQVKTVKKKDVLFWNEEGSVGYSALEAVLRFPAESKSGDKSQTAE